MDWDLSTTVDHLLLLLVDILEILGKIPSFKALVVGVKANRFRLEMLKQAVLRTAERV